MTEVNEIEKMPSVDAIDDYYQGIKHIPFLSNEEELECARRYRDHGDIHAANKIVHAHLKLAASVARGYSGYGLAESDLVQEANVGLMKAVRKFDPEIGCKFSTFSMHYIKAEINQYVLNNCRQVRIATTKAHRKLFFNLRSMRRSEHLTPEEVTSIAALLNVTEHDVIDMNYRLNAKEVSIDEPVNHEENLTLADMIEMDGANPEEILSDVQQVVTSEVALTSAISSLDDRSRKIVKSRWLSEKTATLHELAAEFNISYERVRQIEVKALEKIKKYMESSFSLAMA